MAQQPRSNRISSGVIAAISAAVLTVGGGVAWLTWHSANNTTIENPNIKTPQTVQPHNQAPQGIEQTTSIYLLRDNGKYLEPVPKQIKVIGTTPDEILKSAFNALLEQPTDEQNSSAIPKGTKLLGVKVEGNTVYVDFSEEFTTGGGSASMIGRIGQVVYTASALNENAKVFIKVNGKQLDVLGGEGLELEQPLTRETFNKEYQL